MTRAQVMEQVRQIHVSCMKATYNENDSKFCFFCQPGIHYQNPLKRKKINKTKTKNNPSTGVSLLPRTTSTAQGKSRGPPQHHHQWLPQSTNSRPNLRGSTFILHSKQNHQICTQSTTFKLIRYVYMSDHVQITQILFYIGSKISFNKMKTFD